MATSDQADAEAAGLKYTTSSGRQAQVSEKVRLNLFDRAERFYRCELVEFTRVTNTLRRYLREETDVGAVQHQYSDWKELFRKVQDSIQRLRALAKPSEWRSLEPDVQELNNACKELKYQTELYIELNSDSQVCVPVERHNQQLEQLSQNMNIEIQELQTQVDRLELELSRKLSPVEPVRSSPVHCVSDPVPITVSQTVTTTSVYQAPVGTIPKVAFCSSGGVHLAPRYHSSPNPPGDGISLSNSVASRVNLGGYTSFSNFGSLPSVMQQPLIANPDTRARPMTRTRRLAQDFTANAGRYSSRYQGNDNVLSGRVMYTRRQEMTDVNMEEAGDTDTGGQDEASPKPERSSETSAAGSGKFKAEMPFGQLMPETVEVIKTLAGVFLSQQENARVNDKLPRLQPAVFTGEDVLQFPIWWNSFKSLIEATKTDNNERLFYLGQYTSNEAYDCISCYMHLINDPNAYLEAKRSLMRNYGTKLKIAEAYRAKVAGWSVIKKGDSAALRKYSNFLWQCHAAASSIGYLDVLSEQDENVKLSSKLPDDVCNRWNRYVVESCTKKGGGNEFIDFIDPDTDSSSIPTGKVYPTFREFCEFVERESRFAAGPCARKDERVSVGSVGKRKIALRTEASGVPCSEPATKTTNAPRSNVNNSKNGGRNKGRTNKCFFCKKLNHCVDSCTEFAAKSEEDRKAFLKQTGICFACHRRRHRLEECRRKNNPILVDDSLASVHTSLHSSTMISVPNSMPPVTAASFQSESFGPTRPPVSVYSANTVALIPYTAEGKINYTTVVSVYVWNKNCPARGAKVYALLDTQSNSCFISEDLRDALYPDPDKEFESIDIKISTMGNEFVQCSSTVHEDLCITGTASGCYALALPKCFSRPEIPCSRASIPRPEQVVANEHLQFLRRQISPYDPEMEVCMLIGYNCPAAFVPLHVAVHPSAPFTSPFAVKTALGWCVSGPSETVDDEPLGIEKLFVNVVVKEITVEKVRLAFDSDFSFSPDQDYKKYSYEDVCFSRLMETKGFQDFDSHLVLPLPVREMSTLPDSRSMAYRRLMSLKRKLLADSVYLERYKKFMMAMFAENQVEAAPEIGTGNWRFWYLPHQGVYHPRKPDKLRVVFDGSAEVRGVCLNSILMTGPDLCNNLTGVLCRFREEKVAFTCDIKGMFLQVKVREEDRDFLRFYWFEDHDPHKRVLEFRITVHLFGAASSPSCATFALRKTAEMYSAYFGQEIVDFIKRNFYVDDGLKSVKDDETALHFVHQSRALCKSGGFILHQFSCTSKAVMDSISPDIRTKETVGWSLSKNLPSQFMLGCELSLETDEFLYNFKLESVCNTRRKMLSALSSAYDPLGLISPAILPGRHLLQAMCRQKCGWDEELETSVVDKWNEWYLNLATLSEIRIPRCYLGPMSFFNVAEMHVFSDASEIGIGTCAYLVLRSEDQAHVTLVMAKSKVTPVRNVTVPRLELQAAVNSVKLMEFLRHEMPYSALEFFFWTDSQIVLSYICNAKKRFHVFVANRIQYIRDRTRPEQWGYVPTSVNPADVASRGVVPETLVSLRLWWNGPEFLRDTSLTPSQPAHLTVSDSDPEIKLVSMNSVVTPAGSLTKWLIRYSSWRQIVRVVAWWLKIIDRFQPSRNYVPKITVSDEIRAVTCLVRWIQEEAFHRELALFRSGCGTRKYIRALPSSSFLHSLNVFVDAHGVMRIGGRLSLSSTLPLETVHPIVLPHGHVLVDLLIYYYHQRSAHAGRTTTINSLRVAGYWILRLRRTADRIIRGCVPCRRLRGRVSSQQMANLPLDRITPCPPFTHCGVDFFGPFYIKERRIVKKRWVSIFTCLVMRGIHLEVTPDMSTTSFINAYRRFVARRGPIRTLRCDRGTNIMGARSELDLAVYGLNHPQISQALLAQGCDWIVVLPNPPYASEMGGIWERMIKSVRSVLAGLLTQHSRNLDEDSLVTFLVEAESIVNSRPLTLVDPSDPSSVPLSPSTLLTLKARNGLPPLGVFVPQDVYARKRWRAVQYLANCFWSQWLKEYLPLLQARSKWVAKQPNLQIGDVVLVVDDSVPRASWPMAKVVAVKTSSDGLVRSLTVRTQTGTYDRAVRKVVFLLRPSDFQN